MKKDILLLSSAALFVLFLSICPISGADSIWNLPAINLSATGGNAYAPEITMDETGHAIAVWQRDDGSDILIQASSSSDYGVSWATVLSP